MLAVHGWVFNLCVCVCVCMYACACACICIHPPLCIWLWIHMSLCALESVLKGVCECVCVLCACVPVSPKPVWLSLPFSGESLCHCLEAFHDLCCFVLVSLYCWEGAQGWKVLLQISGCALLLTDPADLAPALCYWLNVSQTNVFSVPSNTLFCMDVLSHILYCQPSLLTDEC